MCWRSAAVLCWMLAAVPVQAEPAATPGPESLRGEVERLVEALDSDRFENRRHAEQRLAELLEEPAGVEALAELLQTHDRHLSLEVRSRLEPLLDVTGKGGSAAAGDEHREVTDEELDRLIDALDADRFAVRTAAAGELQRLADRPQPATKLVRRLKEHFDRPALSADARERMQPLYEQARGTWLHSDPAKWDLPAVPESQIERWLDELSRPSPGDHSGPWQAHVSARRNLLDLLARDEYVPQLKRSIEARLERPLDGAAAERLGELIEWTQPGLVAEIWQHRSNMLIQYLYVDVPQLSAGAVRASHFDRVDDRSVHCVSGSNLVPGDYPVGVAIAHPEGRTRDGSPWMCHIVNLPTPRRRMAYEYTAKIDDRQRLAELTTRTVAHWAAEGRHLTPPEMIMLYELDPEALSESIGRYFLAVDDRRLADASMAATHHGSICVVLSAIGTRHIAPALLEALAKDRFLDPEAQDLSFNWPWIAALAIAGRDPWPNVDTWLAGQIVRQDPLLAAQLNGEAVDDEGALQHPELGATAAAMLLTRHGEAPSQFGLSLQEAPEIDGFEPYVFTSEAARRQVLKWWEEQAKRSPRTAGRTGARREAHPAGHA